MIELIIEKRGCTDKKRFFIIYVTKESHLENKDLRHY